MDSHHRLLAAFLAGELNPAEARRWDQHLLECEQCWRAVREDRAGRQAAQALRQPAPPGLADRVAFAVEVAASARPSGRRLTVRLRWLLAGAGSLAVGVVATLAIVLLPGGRSAESMPAAVAAVAHYAQTVREPAGEPYPQPGWRAAPVEVGRPVMVTAGGQRIMLRTWRLGSTEAVVATSGQPFPMPTRAQGVTGRGMAWSARVGPVGLYCLNGPTSELVAAPVPAAELAALAARLPPA